MSKPPDYFPTFEEFFEALLGVGKPYAWQSALAREVQERGFPDDISVPTGMGKTSVIAIWLYGLARQIHYGEPRTMPMRLFYVVNRRSVVDQGARYAQGLQSKLEGDARQRVLQPVRAALETLLPPGDNRLLVTAAIHGESPDNKAWMRATGATVVSLTPTQLVSRALMRGVNVSARTRSMHAGLVGVDRLVVFDEPHLAVPSIYAMKDQERLQSKVAGVGMPLGKTVLLGATIPDITTGLAPDKVVEKTAFEFRVDANVANSRARQRLLASKKLKLISTTNTSAATLAAQSRRFVEQMTAAGKDRLLLVLNTVEAAQRVYQSVSRLGSNKRPPNVSLLTSRFRGVEKLPVQDLQDGPLVLVSTQTVEAGLDVSFQALFTEATSFDALVQRLGRLNRTGEEDNAPAWLAAASGGAGRFKISKPTAHIYGEGKVDAALRLLQAHEKKGEVDVSPLALRSLRDKGGAQLEGVLPRPATLHSGLVPVLSQTAPTPISDLPMEAFIAGPDECAVREVEVAWRAELTPFDTVNKTNAAAPLSGEYISVPMGQLRAFLEQRKSNEQTGDRSDLDEQVFTGAQLRGERVQSVRVLNPGADRWTTILNTGQIRPGAKVVLLDALGGYKPALGWLPSSTEPVPTVQLEALLQQLDNQRAEADFREPKRLQLVAGTGLAAEAEQLTSKNPDLPEAVGRVLQAATDFSAVESGSPKEVRVAADELTREANKLIDTLTEGQGLPATHREITGRVFKGGVVIPVQLKAKTQRKAKPEPVFLADHSHQVASWVRAAALAAGMKEDLAESLAQAGFYHDAGKAWGPYQRLLGASEDSKAGRLLAKSLPSAKTAGRLGSVVAAAHGVPRGWRHEAHSTTYIPNDLANCQLVKHLLLSSHGWGRPWVPARGVDSALYQHDAHGGLEPLRAGLPDEFLQLNSEFGPWGLAYLEATLRLADWTASASPRKQGSQTTHEDGAPDARSQATRFVVDRSIKAGKEAPLLPLERLLQGEEHRLVGLAQFPLASWYAAVGLLAAATQSGDKQAGLHWSGAGNLPAVAPTLPTLTSKFSWRELVESVVGSNEWSLTKADLAENGCRPFGVKGQKMGPASKLRGLLLRAESESIGLVLGSISDAAPSEKGVVHMAIPAFPNNSSYPGLAQSAAIRGDAVDRALEALVDPNAGYSVGAADGGLDRPENYDPAVSGSLGKDRRLVRAGLAPLVLWGMTAWGSIPPLGYGCHGREIELPLPKTPVSLNELRALTLLGANGRRRLGMAGDDQWVLAGKKKFDRASKQEWWVVAPNLVSEE